MKIYFKNLILSLVLASLVLTPLNFSFQKNEANAQVQIVKDIYLAIVSTLNQLANAAQAALDKISWSRDIKQFAKDTAFEILKQAVLDRLVNNLIRWIEGGGRGAIVDDWDAFFQSAANRAGGIFANRISNGMLCGPFNLQVQLALLPVETFESQATCTLNDVIRNIDGFMEDFRDGSWIGYQATWEPRNNFYGATLMAIDEQSRAINDAVTAAAAEAAAGNGFLSFKKCDIKPDENGTLDEQGNPWKPIAAESGIPNPKYSKKCAITTPGKIAGDAVTKALIDAPFDKAQSASSKLIASYLAAIVNASVNRLTKIAVTGLKGVVAETLKDTKINPVLPCADLTGESFKACMATVNAEKQEYGSYQEGLKSIASQPLELRFRLAGVYAQSISSEQGLLNSLVELAVCKNNQADLLTKISEEQEIIETLQTKFDDNQTYIENLEQVGSQFDSPSLSESITPEDWSALGNMSDTSSSDISGLPQEIVAAEEELEVIKTKVAEQLPGIELQLQSCPKLITAPPSNF